MLKNYFIFRNAKTRVILTNVGPNAIHDYGSEIIVERNINPTSSTYALKSKSGQHEEVKSRKKGDLDEILRHFNIELENPLSWLSQDRSRQFLQQMKPDKLYSVSFYILFFFKLNIIFALKVKNI